MCLVRIFFFFNDTATTEIYTLSLHDALPISDLRGAAPAESAFPSVTSASVSANAPSASAKSAARSEEHTSELQSQSNLVCRLLLEKKKNRAIRGHSCGRTSMSQIYSQSFRTA